MKRAYLALSTDFIRTGHLNVIERARALGTEVIVGVLTDEAIAKYKRPPLLDFEQRVLIASNLRGVTKVVRQETLDYTENLRKYRPQFVVHGDDWKVGPQSEIRTKVIETLKDWDGELVEIPYTLDSSVDELRRNRGITPDLRLKSLDRLLELKPLIRVMEVHNGITGLIVENTSVKRGNQTIEFDAMWESSLTDSTSKGKPDTQAVDISSRVATIDQILDVTTKPIIVDGDNGGQPEHFTFTVRTLERLGVSAVIIEDKIGIKRNSLFGTEASTPQEQDPIDQFAAKLAAGRRARVTKDFKIIARIESLILKKGLKDALERAEAYVSSGADGILIHSKERNSDEVMNFAKEFRSLRSSVPLVVVPTTYNDVRESELSKAGVRMVIYANQLLRSAFPAMQAVAKSILTHGRAFEAEEHCLPIKEIISMIPPSH